LCNKNIARLREGLYTTRKITGIKQGLNRGITGTNPCQGLSISFQYPTRITLAEGVVKRGI
jgi:hypothetical protein